MIHGTVPPHEKIKRGLNVVKRGQNLEQTKINCRGLKFISITKSFFLSFPSSYLMGFHGKYMSTQRWDNLILMAV